MSQAPADHAVHPLIRERHSPRTFAERAVERDHLRSLLEAARWAPSSFNDQPWRFVVATQSEDPEGFARLLACLAPPNQAWAKDAPVLLVTATRLGFRRNDKPNRHAWHDVGLAMGQMAIQGTELGIVMHQMAGFDSDAARAAIGMPDAFVPVAAVALGYAHPSAPQSQPRTRLPQAELVFGSTWGEPLTLGDESAIDAVLNFWVGPLDAEGDAHPAKRAMWWGGNPALDATIAERFGGLHARLAAGEHQDWLDTPRGRLAAIIVLDQFSRNIFRDTPGMYATDATATRWVHEGLARGDDRSMPPAWRAFFQMPLMHSEDLADQDLCVALCRALCDSLAGPARSDFGNYVRFAIQHRDIVARFGRFPHRNAILGRESTPEEVDFLKQPGSSF